VLLIASERCSDGASPSPRPPLDLPSAPLVPPAFSPTLGLSPLILLWPTEQDPDAPSTARPSGRHASHSSSDGGPEARDSPADGRGAEVEPAVVIDLARVVEIVLVGDTEIHLAIDAYKAHKLRSPDDAGPGYLRRWFDALVLKLEEVRTTAQHSASSLEETDEVEKDIDHHMHAKWHAMPSGGGARLMHVLVFPLKAAIHATIPDVHQKGCAKYYTITLLLAIVWLALLAYVLTLMLDEIGCELNVSSTVMGLTIGAMGTSFPNLYASILTAKAGQGDQAICQAYGSNTFNVLIALGLVWLVETTLGSCSYGSYTQPHFAWCNGCYMPTGVLCPYLDNKGPELNARGPELAAGSLSGTIMVCFVCMVAFIIALLCGSGRLTKGAAGVFFAIYFLYVAYEFLASIEGDHIVQDPVCLFGLCL